MKSYSFLVRKKVFMEEVKNTTAVLFTWNIIKGICRFRKFGISKCVTVEEEFVCDSTTLFPYK